METHQRPHGYRKVRYRGLHKTTCQLHTLFALANLLIAGYSLMIYQPA